MTAVRCIHSLYQAAQVFALLTAAAELDPKQVVSSSLPPGFAGRSGYGAAFHTCGEFVQPEDRELTSEFHLSRMPR